MDANEIIKNEEIIEVTEEIADVCSNNGAKITAGIGLTIAVGGLAYKFIIKPVKAKIEKKLNEKIDEAIERYVNETSNVLEEESEEEQEEDTDE